MNYVIENMSRRPVTILCNSGKSHHLPPRYRKTFQDIEVSSNQMIDKLKARRILNMMPADEETKTKSSPSAKKRPASKK